MQLCVGVARPQVLFVVSFFCVRTLFGNYISYYWWLQMLEFLSLGKAHSTWIYYGYLACNGVLNSLNVVWLLQMVGSAVRGGKKSKDGAASAAEKKSS